MLYKARNEAIKFYDDYSLMMSEAKSKAKQNDTKGTGLKILTPKQMLQRLPIALAQVKAGNNSENLLNNSDKLFIHCIKQKKLLSIQQLNRIFIKIDTIFVNSENSRTSEPHILKLKLTDKLDLRLDKKVIALSDVVCITHGVILKVQTIIINLKYQHQHGMENLHYQMGLIQYHISKIIFNIF